MQVTFTYLISLVKISLCTLTAYKTSINYPTSLPPVFPPSLQQHQLTTWSKKRRLSSPPGARTLATPSTAETAHKPFCSAEDQARDVSKMTEGYTGPAGVTTCDLYKQDGWKGVPNAVPGPAIKHVRRFSAALTALTRRQQYPVPALAAKHEAAFSGKFLK